MSFTRKSEPLLANLIGDPVAEALFTDQADITAILRFESALAEAQAGIGMIPDAAAERIAETCRSFKPDMETLAHDTARDGLCVPGLIRQLRSATGDPFSEFVHFGTTSQDAIDTALTLRLASYIPLISNRLGVVLTKLATLDQRFGTHGLIGVTRMQEALPIHVSDRLSAWASAISARRAALDVHAPALLSLQLAGPVGTASKYGDRTDDLRRALAEILDLTDPGRSWQTDRTGLADFAGWLSTTAGVLGKIGQDIALMALGGQDQIKMAKGGGSSAMPHKSNPVLAETLVALARYTATLLPGMHTALIHEQERSGAAWTLEWLILPDMCVATAAATRQAIALLDSIETIGMPER